MLVRVLHDGLMLDWGGKFAPVPAGTELDISDNIAKRFIERGMLEAVKKKPGRKKSKTE